MADEGPALLTEAHVPREVAGLLALNARFGEDGAEGADVGDDIVALGDVALDLVGGVGEGYAGVWFTYWRNLD